MLQEFLSPQTAGFHQRSCPFKSVASRFFITFSAGLLVAGLFGGCSGTKPKPTGPVIEVKNGERISDFCKRLAGRKLLDCATMHSLAGADYKEPFMPPVSAPARFEGIFLPGKYTMPETVTPCPTSQTDCSGIFHRNGQSIIAELLKHAGSRFGVIPWTELRKQVILASIVEKEAASNRYYGNVASVFHNRLKSGMTLGSCPTVEYALGYHRPFLLFKDIEINSPYNVYKRKGLPPSPIAFFSDKAFQAAGNPPKTDYVFFVFDWTDGEMYFSTNLKAHQTKAKGARQRFIDKYGKENLRKVFYDKYYEML